MQKSICSRRLEGTSFGKKTLELESKSRLPELLENKLLERNLINIFGAARLIHYYSIIDIIYSKYMVNSKYMVRNLTIHTEKGYFQLHS